MAHLRPLGEDDVDALVAHMQIHAAETGRQGDSIFMPWGAEHPLDTGRYGKRRLGIWAVAVGSPGWGRTWGLLEGERIVGHVELNGGVIPADLHRCTLGMGLERPWRGAGHGRAMLELAVGWARRDAGIDWIDLGVFGENERARRLYEEAGFRELGRCDDRYRVDGRRVDNIEMALFVGNG